jgi:hypothetical protein
MTVVNCSAAATFDSFANATIARIIASENCANALNHLHDTRSITLRTPLVAMSKLRIFNHPARSGPTATIRAMAG